MRNFFITAFVLCVFAASASAQKQEHKFILNKNVNSKESTTLSVQTAKAAAQNDRSARAVTKAAGDLEEIFNGSVFPPSGWTVTNSSTGDWYSWESSNHVVSRYQKGNSAQIGTAGAILSTGDGKHAVFSPFVTSGEWSRLETPVVTANANRTLVTFELFEICMSSNWLSPSGMELYVDVYADGQWVNGSENILLRMAEHNTGQQFSVHSLATSADLSQYIGKDIKIGFRAVSDDGGITLLLDNIRFATLATVPSFNGDSSVNLGSGKDLYTNFSAQYQIENFGGDTLVVTQHAPVEGITIEGLPVKVVAGDPKTITIKLNAAGLDGYIEKDIVLSTNDPLQNQITVTAYADVLAVKVRNYINESFNTHTYLPKDWQDFSHNVEVLPNAGVNGTNAVVGAIFYNENLPFMDEAAVGPPLVAIDEHSVFSMKYKAVYTGTEIIASPYEYSIDVYYATLSEIRAVFSQPDQQLSGRFLTALEPTVTNDFVTYSMPSEYLSVLYGDTVLFNIVAFVDPDANNVSAIFDDIKIGTPHNNDLDLAGIFGSALGVKNKEMNLMAEVSNIGENAVNAVDYATQLISNNDTLATAQSTPILSGESVINTLKYTPTTEGTLSMHVQVAYDVDENQTNNTGKEFRAKIFPQTTTLLEAAGNNEENTYAVYAPMYLFYKNSVTQTIYHPSDIGSNIATIKGIAYQFSFDNPVAALPMEVWIGTTEYEDYISDGQWIDTGSLTKVFSGQNTVEDRYNDRLYIPFNQNYEYTGGNLVLYVVRRSDVYYSLNEYFAATSMPARTLYYYHELSLPLDPQFLNENGFVEDFIPNTTFITEVNNAGSLSGIITGTNGDVLQGVKVELLGAGLITHTDINGKYKFPYLKADSLPYSVKATIKHYKDTALAISVVSQQESVLNIQLKEEPSYSLTYHIKDSYNKQPLQNVSIRLEGDDNYTDTTDVNGVCTFAKVYGGPYRLQILASDYYPFNDDVNVNSVAEDTVTLSEKFFVSGAVNAAISVAESLEDTSVFVSWSAPKTFTEFRYDNGILGGSLGSQQGDMYGVMGCAYLRQSEVNAVSWFTVKNPNFTHDFVNVFIFSLDDNGLPTNNILYHQLDVPNTDDVWNTLYLSSLVIAPNGFFVALSYNYGYLGIGAAKPDAAYPFAPAQYFAANYTENQFIPIGEAGYNVNIMIRATVTDLDPTVNSTSMAKAISSSFTDYTLFRLSKGSPRSEWTKLTQSADISYVDNDFEMQPSGIYQYAVITNYYNGSQVSNAALSNSITKGWAAGNELSMQKDRVSVYPNPAKGLIYVQTLEPATVTVSDMTGHIVEQRRVSSGSAAFNLKIDGAYFVKITNSERSSVFKVINNK
jgi:hypothetical protein